MLQQVRIVGVDTLLEMRSISTPLRRIAGGDVLQTANGVGYCAKQMPAWCETDWFRRGHSLTLNDVRERRGPAAADFRFVSELNGWSPSAPRMGFGVRLLICALLW